MTRLTAEHRRAQIVAAAYALSADGGLYDWTLGDVARRIDVSRSLVRHYYKSAIKLRARIVRDAIRKRDVPIVAQAINKCDPLTNRIGPALRAACAEYVGG